MIMIQSAIKQINKFIIYDSHIKVSQKSKSKMLRQNKIIKYEFDNGISFEQTEQRICSEYETEELGRMREVKNEKNLMNDKNKKKK